jgi:hypothetical protein
LADLEESFEKTRAQRRNPSMGFLALSAAPSALRGFAEIAEQGKAIFLKIGCQMHNQVFLSTFALFLRAFERPIAIAGFRFVTSFFDFPLLNLLYLFLRIVGE